MLEFRKVTNGFNFIFEKDLAAHESVIVKMPPVSSNKRGINDVGWQASGDVSLYGTLSSKPESASALWQEINERDDVNKTVSAIKIVNNGSECSVAVRVILC